MPTTTEQRDTVDGFATHWFEAPFEGTPTLYLHGVPASAFEWKPFLERTGGYAPDLVGFGESDKPSNFVYGMANYRKFIERFLELRGVDRLNLVVHDWGGFGVTLAMDQPERIERLVIINALPLLPYRWHWVARMWRRPVLGEMFMGFTFKYTLKRLTAIGQREPLPKLWLDETWKNFDHGTQRAILKLYRSAPESQLRAAGENLSSITAPTLVIWGEQDPYLATQLAHDYAAAIGDNATVQTVPGTGHWPWFDEPGVVDDVAKFLRG